MITNLNDSNDLTNKLSNFEKSFSSSEFRFTQNCVNDGVFNNLNNPRY